jgi:hypothetical protein
MVRHIATLKHKKRANGNDGDTDYFTAAKENICKCGKKYKTQCGLWKHKKTCAINIASNNVTDNIASNNIVDNVVIKESPEPDIKLLTNLVIEIVKNNNELQKQNYELQKQVIDVCQKIQPSQSNINSHNNNNNKTFNLQFFLHEECKDAMNIMDFVNSVSLQLTDLESVGKLGYVEGITNIMIKRLNEMDIYKRPVHCCDAKRETMYVKDENKWEKENATYSKLRKAIKYISKKNSDMLTAWSDNHPASKNISSYLNEEYMKIIQQAMGGGGDLQENENKIIKKISKMVLIEK